MRRATIIVASASGTPVPAIARLVTADEDTVRAVLHRLHEIGVWGVDADQLPPRSALIRHGLSARQDAQAGIRGQPAAARLDRCSTTPATVQPGEPQ